MAFCAGRPGTFPRLSWLLVCAPVPTQTVPFHCLNRPVLTAPRAHRADSHIRVRPTHFAPCVPVSPPRALRVTSIFLMFWV